MIEIIKADIQNIPEIIDLAHKTWFHTYQNIISKEQIDYMYGEMYSPDSLLKQMEFLKHQFLIIKHESIAKGFASYSELIDVPEKSYKIHKLYILPNAQKLGLGKKLIDEIETIAKNEAAEYVLLNVNRSNPAYQFYLKNKYVARESVDIPFAEFVLNDYVMEKKLV